MQILRPHPRPAMSDTLAALCVCTSPPGNSKAASSSKITSPEQKAWVTCLQCPPLMSLTLTWMPSALRQWPCQNSANRFYHQTNISPHKMGLFLQRAAGAALRFPGSPYPHSHCFDCTWCLQKPGRRLRSNRKHSIQSLPWWLENQTFSEKVTIQGKLKSLMRLEQHKTDVLSSLLCWIWFITWNFLKCLQVINFNTQSSLRVLNCEALQSGWK